MNGKRFKVRRGGDRGCDEWTALSGEEVDLFLLLVRPTRDNSPNFERRGSISL